MPKRRLRSALGAVIMTPRRVEGLSEGTRTRGRAWRVLRPRAISACGLPQNQANSNEERRSKLKNPPRSGGGENVSQRTIALLMIGLGTAMLVGWSSRAAEQDVARPPAPPAPAKFLGAASCSASACHGGSGPRGARLSEYTTWIAHDPHARAYDSLLEEPSLAIAKRLGIPAAHQETLCLKCHALPEYQPGAMTPRFRVEDGVGCESCHGPAQRWVNEHYRQSWRAKPTAEKTALGMRDTKSLAARAQACVRCHVGSPGMDVNHDLIAAGHPPLRFEFAAFHANQPRHWDHAKDRSMPDFEARAWSVGQVVSAEAACHLLAERAGNAHRHWPEFGESDCAACHHKLSATSRRQERRSPGRRP